MLRVASCLHSAVPRPRPAQLHRSFALVDRHDLATLGKARRDIRLVHEELLIPLAKLVDRAVALGSGALAPLVPVGAGDRIHMTISGIGAASLHFVD